jgi:hypothetical protein
MVATSSLAKYGKLHMATTGQPRKTDKPIIQSTDSNEVTAVDFSGAVVFSAADTLRIEEWRINRSIHSTN